MTDGVLYTRKTQKVSGRNRHTTVQQYSSIRRTVPHPSYLALSPLNLAIGCPHDLCPFCRVQSYCSTSSHTQIPQVQFDIIQVNRDLLSLPSYHFAFHLHLYCPLHHALLSPSPCITVPFTMHCYKNPKPLQATYCNFSYNCNFLRVKLITGLLVHFYSPRITFVCSSFYFPRYFRFPCQPSGPTIQLHMSQLVVSLFGTELRLMTVLYYLGLVHGNNDYQQ